MATTGRVLKDDGTYDIVEDDVVINNVATEAEAITAMKALGIYAADDPTPII